MHNKSAAIKNQEERVSYCLKIIRSHGGKFLVKFYVVEGAAFCFSPGKRKVSKHENKIYFICQ
jgi:hypothetical protein